MLNQEFVMEINKALRELFWKDVPGIHRDKIKNMDPVCCDDSIVVTYQKKDGLVMTIYDKPIDENFINEEIRKCKAGGDGPEAAMVYVARTIAADVMSKSIEAVKGYEELLSLGKEISLEKEQDDFEKEEER